MSDTDTIRRALGAFQEDSDKQGDRAAIRNALDDTFYAAMDSIYKLPYPSAASKPPATSKANIPPKPVTPQKKTTPIIPPRQASPILQQPAATIPNLLKGIQDNIAGGQQWAGETFNFDPNIENVIGAGAGIGNMLAGAIGGGIGKVAEGANWLDEAMVRARNVEQPGELPADYKPFTEQVADVAGQWQERIAEPVAGTLAKSYLDVGGTLSPQLQNPMDWLEDLGRGDLQSALFGREKPDTRTPAQPTAASMLLANATAALQRGDVGAAISNGLSAFKDFGNAEYERLSPNDKFIASLIFDPINFIPGLGIGKLQKASKLDEVGRVVGKIDDAAKLLPQSRVLTPVAKITETVKSALGELFQRTANLGSADEVFDTLRAFEKAGVTGQFDDIAKKYAGVATIGGNRATKLLQGFSKELDTVEAGHRAAVTALKGAVVDPKTLPKTYTRFLDDVRANPANFPNPEAALLDVTKAELTERTQRYMAQTAKGLYPQKGLNSPQNIAKRFLNNLKAAEALVYIGLSPFTFLRNVVNGITTMALEGVNPLWDAAQEVGRLKALGQVEKAAALNRAIKFQKTMLNTGDVVRQAMGEGGYSTAMTGAMGSFMSKMMKQTGLGKPLEWYQAMENAMRARVWTQTYWKGVTSTWVPGKGFELMGAADEVVLGQYGQTPKFWYDIVEEAGPNEGAILRRVNDVFAGRAGGALDVDALAVEMGMTRQDLIRILDEHDLEKARAMFKEHWTRVVNGEDGAAVVDDVVGRAADETAQATGARTGQLTDIGENGLPIKAAGVEDAQLQGRLNELVQRQDELDRELNTLRGSKNKNKIERRRAIMDEMDALSTERTELQEALGMTDEEILFGSNPAFPEPPKGAKVVTPEPTTGSVPFQITRDMRQQLYDLKYSKADVDAMKPQQAQDILQAGKGRDIPPEAPAAPVPAPNPPDMPPGGSGATNQRIKWISDQDLRTPEHKDFQANWLTRVDSDRAAVIAKAEELTGLKIVDVGNANALETRGFLDGLVSPFLREKLPDDVTHVVFGHGTGTGDNWQFLRTKKTVQQIVDDSVPAGQKAWVVACEDAAKRNFATIEGKEIVSRGGITRPPLESDLPPVDFPAQVLSQGQQNARDYLLGIKRADGTPLYTEQQLLTWKPETLENVAGELQMHRTTFDDIMRTARDRKVPTATDKGAPNNRNLLNVLNKHKDAAAPKFATIDDVRARGDEAVKILDNYTPSAKPPKAAPVGKAPEPVGGTSAPLGAAGGGDVVAPDVASIQNPIKVGTLSKAYRQGGKWFVYDEQLTNPAWREVTTPSNAEWLDTNFGESRATTPTPRVPVADTAAEVAPANVTARASVAPKQLSEIEQKVQAEYAKGKFGKSGGFTPTQEDFLIDRLKKIVDEAGADAGNKRLQSTKQVIQVPGDGTVSVIPDQAESLLESLKHRGPSGGSAKYLEKTIEEEADRAMQFYGRPEEAAEHLRAQLENFENAPFISGNLPPKFKLTAEQDAKRVDMNRLSQVIEELDRRAEGYTWETVSSRGGGTYTSKKAYDTDEALKRLGVAPRPMTEKARSTFAKQLEETNSRLAELQAERSAIVPESLVTKKGNKWQIQVSENQVAWYNTKREAMQKVTDRLDREIDDLSEKASYLQERVGSNVPPPSEGRMTLDAGEPQPLDELAQINAQARIAALRRMGIEDEAATSILSRDEMTKAKARTQADMYEAMQNLLSRADVKRYRLGTDVQARINAWLRRGVLPGAAETRQAATVAADWTDNAVMISRDGETHFDAALGVLSPFQFWRSRFALQSLRRVADKPARLAWYLKLREGQDQIQDDPRYPKRLRGMMQIPFPFAPAWAGPMFADVLEYGTSLEQVFGANQFEDGVTDADVAKAIRALAADGKISLPEAQNAIANMQGTLWQQMKDRMVELNSTSAGADDLASLFRPHLPLDIIWKLKTGRADEIGVLFPMTRIIRNTTGVNIEQPIKAGLRSITGDPNIPDWDMWEESRTDKALADMVGDGLLSERDALIALIERKGDAFEQARLRAAEQMKLQNFSVFGGQLFPTGEQEYYKSLITRNRYMDEAVASVGANPADLSYGEKWDVIKANNLNKKGTPLQQFYDEYPVYSTRQSVYDEPEARLKEMLMDEIWAGYNSKGKLDKRLMADDLGEAFKTLMLDKDTRDLTNVTLDQLGEWTRRIRGYVPQQDILQVGDFPEVRYGTLDQNERYNNIAAQRDRLFNMDVIAPKLDTYHNLSKDDARAYRDIQTDLDAYLDWYGKSMRDNPDIAQLLNPEYQAFTGSYVNTRDAANDVTRYTVANLENMIRRIGGRNARGGGFNPNPLPPNAKPPVLSNKAKQAILAKRKDPQYFIPREVFEELLAYFRTLGIRGGFQQWLDGLVMGGAM